MMSKERYNYFCKNIHSRDDVLHLATKHPDVSFNTLLCIYSQKYQELTRKTLHKHKEPKVVANYFKRYLDGEEIIEIAEDINIAPCLLARLIVQCYIIVQYSSLKPGNAEDLFQEIAELIENQLSVDGTMFKSEVSKRIKDPSIIQDERLRVEVKKCVDYDDNYSPLVEKIRHTTGMEYEYILQEKLTSLGIGFMTEDELRAQGYPKTPDVKLLIPILVNDHVINWIDSKASFGDEYSHRLNRDQFFGYKNRYGPGLVIYWFGFIQELQEWDPNILLLSHFPTNIVKLEIMNI